MKKNNLFLLLIATASTLVCSSGYADEERHFREREHEHRYMEFHDRDVHRFNHREMIEWRGGSWVRAVRGGIDGWWWVIGPRWFYYPAPVYPYPLMVSERMVVVDAPPVMAPPMMSPPVSPQGTTVVPPQYAAPPPDVRYFCQSLGRYYPEVGQCPEPWKKVSAVPPGPISPR